MSGVCDWCDGAGCDACASMVTQPSTTQAQIQCDWCDNVGCDACRTNQGSGSAGTAVPGWGDVSKDSNAVTGHHPTDPQYQENGTEGWGSGLPSQDDDGWGTLVHDQAGQDDGGWASLTLSTADTHDGGDHCNMQQGHSDLIQSILNTFYEAEYSEENAKFAAFESVVERIAESRQVLANEEVRRAFVACIFRLAERAIKNLGSTPQASEEQRLITLERILAELGGMASDEARDGLTSYLELCSNEASRSISFAAADLPPDADFSKIVTPATLWLTQVNRRITDALSVEPKFASVLFALLLKQAKDAVAQRNLDTARVLLTDLYRLTALEGGAQSVVGAVKHLDTQVGPDVVNNDPIDHSEFMEAGTGQDPNFHRKLEQRMQVYAIEVSLARLNNDTRQLKRIFEATRGMRHAVTDSRTQIMLKECAGQVLGDAGRWTQAYQDLYQAFNHAREVGDIDSARRLLAYAMIANLSSSQDINPLEAPEARAFARSTPLILAIAELRTAYESGSPHDFEVALDQLKRLFQATGDAWGLSHLADVSRVFRRSRFKKLVRAYKTLKLEFIARRLLCTEAEAKDMIVSLILTEELNASLDDLDNTVHIHTGGIFVDKVLGATPSTSTSSAIPLPDAQTLSKEDAEKAAQLATSQTALLNIRYLAMKTLLEKGIKSTPR